MNLSLSLDLFNKFQGGWSYNQDEIFYAFSQISNIQNNTVSVLEFGCGEGTKKIYEVLKSMEGISITYDCYESNPHYAINHDGINCIIYDENNIDSVELGTTKYNIILVDGPNGVLRSKWYRKIKNLLDVGSVLLIDDYNHYLEFSQEIKNHIETMWKCEEKVYNTEFPLINLEKSWKAMKIIGRKQ